MRKIFVLEDDQDIREIVVWILEAENYEVVSFKNIDEFMRRDIQNLPDLFLLDVMLPDGSGIDVCNQLRSESVNQHIPILIMSAHASMEQVNSGCSAEGFIQKPFELNSFLERIQKQINPN